MAPSRPTLPAYTEKLYDLCDIFDRYAERSGERAAEVAVDRLLGQTVKAYPKSAAIVLGKAEAAQLIAAHKQTNDIIDRAIALLQRNAVEAAQREPDRAIAEEIEAFARHLVSTDDEATVTKAHAPRSAFTTAVAANGIQVND